MVATAKHSPGHGDTETDSHLALPVITFRLAPLDSVELVPFRAAIAAGVGAVMSAHIALPGIDGGNVRPGTVVPAILAGVLRDSLHFGGLVVTDALNMSGVASLYGAEAAVRAFIAGADLLLQPPIRPPRSPRWRGPLARGEISTERLDRSVRRVLDLKRQLGLFERREVSLDSVSAVVGRAEFLAQARSMAERSIVMVKDAGGVVHDFRKHRQPVILICYGEEDNRTVGNVIAAELRELGYPVTAFKLWASSGPASYDSAAALLAKTGADTSLALFVTADRPVAGRGAIGVPAPVAALIDATARGRRTVLVSLGNPYLIAGLPDVGSYLMRWRSNAVVERAMARALAGLAPITGRLPISIPPLYPIGWGVQRRVP